MSAITEAAEILLKTLEDDFTKKIEEGDEFKTLDAELNVLDEREEELKADKEKIEEELKQIKEERTAKEEKLEELNKFNALEAALEKLPTSKKKEQKNIIELIKYLTTKEVEDKVEAERKKGEKEKNEITAQLTKKTKSHKKKIPKENNTQYSGDNLGDTDKYKYQEDGNYPPYTFKRQGEFQDYYAYHSIYLRCPYNCVEFPRTSVDKAIAHISKCKKNPEISKNKKYKNNPICPNIPDYYKAEVVRLKTEEKKETY